MDMDPDLRDRALGLECTHGILLATRELSTDIMIRHLRVTDRGHGDAAHLQALGPFVSPLDLETDLTDGILRETLHTPVGNLIGTWGLNDDGGWSPHLLEHLVNNRGEPEIFCHAVDHPCPTLPGMHDGVRFLGYLCREVLHRYWLGGNERRFEKRYRERFGEENYTTIREMRT
jgi:hypothetical protein